MYSLFSTQLTEVFRIIAGKEESVSHARLARELRVGLSAMTRLLALNLNSSVDHVENNEHIEKTISC
jgi:hypothetical protein